MSALPTKSASTEPSRLEPVGIVATFGAVVAGIDAALIVTVLGLMYALIAYADLGPGALPFSLASTAIALVGGGLAAAIAGRAPGRIVGPTASGALVIASLIHELQDIDAARGSLEAAIAAAAALVLLAGLAQLAFARLRLGAVLKFVPYPVLMGFADSVALLLVVGMLPAALGHAYQGRLVDLARWFDDWRPVALVVALAGVAVGVATVRWLPRAPATFVALVAATLVQAIVAGTCDGCAPGPTLDLGSTTQPLLPVLSAFTVVVAQRLPYWAAVLQGAVVLAVLNSLFSLLGAAQVAGPRDPPIDGNRLLRSLGIGNLCSGIALGLPVAGLGSPTIAIRRGQARPRVALAIYLACVALTFSVGRHLFELLPMAAIASAVFVASRTLFDTATWPLLRQALSGQAAHRGTRGPFAVATLVVAIGLFRGLASALFVGALAAACLLAIEMRRSVVVAVHDARTRRSRRVRTATEAARLDAAAGEIRIVVLGHWLYFGTADDVVEILERSSDARWLLLDLRHVAGIDLTAARSLVRAAGRLRERGIHLIATGLPSGDTRRESLELFSDDDGNLPLALVDTLDEALEQVEEAVLGPTPDPAAPGAVDRAVGLPGMTGDEALRLEVVLEPVAVAAGTALFRAGDPGDSFYLVRSGRMTIWVAHDDGTRHRLLTFGVDGLFGELALLDGRPRSADAVADVDSRLLRLDRERLDRLAVTDAALHAKVLNGIALHLAHRLRDTTRLLDLG